MKKYLSNKSFLIGFSLVCFFIVFMIAGCFFLPYDPNSPDTANKFASFSREHLLGTDHLGRDIFSRIVVGTRISIGIGFCVMIFGCITGVVLGAVSGYFGGAFDLIIRKIVTVQMSFPGILLAIMLIAVFGVKVQVTIIALCIMSIPRFTRITRSSFMKFKNSLFVKSARAKGASHLRLMVIHILPNALPEILVTCVLSFSLAILSESGLSYLGLGIQPPDPSFGRMLNDAQRFIFRFPQGVVVPSVFLALLVFSFNMLADGISEVNGS